MRPLLVGESNPHDPSRGSVLYPYPGSSGHRLCRIIGVTTSQYLEMFERFNLCDMVWKPVLAKYRASVIMSTRCEKIVLCGSRVASSFGLKFLPFTVERISGKLIVILPHPSGKCRIWNDKRSGELARSVLFAAGILPITSVDCIGGKMVTSKLLVGSGHKRGKVIWMDGTVEEIVTKLRNRFRVYTERPVNGKQPKIANPVKENVVPKETTGLAQDANQT